VHHFFPLVTPPAGRAAAGSAIADAGQRVRCGQHRQQASIRLPAGFVADAAVLCDLTVHLVDGQGHAVDVVGSQIAAWRRWSLLSGGRQNGPRLA
jgi:hypothetical protein